MPAFNKLREWYETQGKSYPGNLAVLEDKEVWTLIKQAVNQYNLEFNPVEQIKKFALIPGEWSIENGELTPTLKLKRRVILERYQDLVSSLYA
ncbi:hypothetical protein [Pontibacter sp. BAB1700]|uniref:hypothetical protein n=1 Tax=Pontibacter sp. BAB1700 TaxID=1144253 RepID=UPI0002E7B5C2